MKKPAGPEVFRLLHLKFDIDKALEISKENETVNIHTSPGWSAMVHIDASYAMKTDLRKPVLIAQIVLDKRVTHVLIDGHHRHFKAMRKRKKTIAAKLLDVEQTLKIVASLFPKFDKKMRKDANEYLKRSQKNRPRAFQT